MKTMEIITTPDSALHVDKNGMNNYAAVRYNAMQHGILSQHVVLPHENKDKFNDLLAALMAEHLPGGATEMHLVEELAGVIWRKRRVLLAEGAKINRNLRGCLHALDGSSSSTVKNAVPSDPALVGVHVDFRDLMSMTSEDLKSREQEAVRDLEATEKAEKILLSNRANAYAKAVKALLPDSRDWWQDQVDDEEVEASVKSLRDFIIRDLMPFCNSRLAEIRHHEAIKRQVVGEGIGAPIMENLSRYETHLDRKFERTLAMLIKLKELRGKK